MATLQPKMGVAGQDQLAELTDVLNEVKPSDDKEKKVSVVTDEIEEKETPGGEDDDEYDSEEER